MHFLIILINPVKYLTCLNLTAVASPFSFFTISLGLISSLVKHPGSYSFLPPGLRQQPFKKPQFAFYCRWHLQCSQHLNICNSQNICIFVILAVAPVHVLLSQTLLQRQKSVDNYWWNASSLWTENIAIHCKCFCCTSCWELEIYYNGTIPMNIAMAMMASWLKGKP